MIRSYTKIYNLTVWKKIIYLAFKKPINFHWTRGYNLWLLIRSIRTGPKQTLYSQRSFYYNWLGKDLLKFTDYSLVQYQLKTTVTNQVTLNCTKPWNHMHGVCKHLTIMIPYNVVYSKKDFWKLFHFFINIPTTLFTKINGGPDLVYGCRDCWPPC